jgi:hypothetical protein
MNEKKDSTSRPEESKAPPPKPPPKEVRPGETRRIPRVESPATSLVKLDPQVLLEQAIEKESGIETIEKLIALVKDVREFQAKEAWYESMAEFQNSCPPIHKTAEATIPPKDGKAGYKYRYAPLEEIMTTILPVMGPLGLTVAWRTRFEEDKVIGSCRISHVLGHSEESGELAMPIPTSTKISPPQRVGVATMYLKRYTLLSVSGLTPEDDPDAQNLGGGKSAAIREPVRESSTGTAPDNLAGETWTGSIVNIDIKTGKKKDGKPWTLYLLQSQDGNEFKTFSETHANFAQEAKQLPVWIEFEETQYGREIKDIGPADNRTPEPPSDDDLPPVDEDSPAEEAANRETLFEK